ncbi:MAG: citrate/2-methylcitrate synthase [Lachnospiraceae bacterium]|nr:citrate/2-methylcitrate synthase [Lachnospiraceae bacterium]
MNPTKYSSVTPEINRLAEICMESDRIDPELYQKYEVKRGLRDLDGKGVLTGLTEISTINSSREIDGVKTPIDGELYYRGINIFDLVNGFTNDNRFGYEETVYLLLFGKLPTMQELTDFTNLLGSYRMLPHHFMRDVIMKTPDKDIMNALAKSILTLSSYDENTLDTSIPNVLRQSIELIANFPSLAVYSYLAYRHYELGHGIYIHRPKPDLSTAENFLRLLRPDKHYTDTEAKVLDLALVLHAEHGGGNNSTFTTHVVTSSGTDTYSSVAASLCSLKGPKHGGANVKVKQMFDDLKAHVTNWNDFGAIRSYLSDILDKKAFDGAGLIYGMGHAVYSISDPRAVLFEKFVKQLSEEKGVEEEYNLYQNVAKLAKEVIAEKRKIYKGVSPNIDFFSGFVFTTLGLPEELFTPLFAVARIAGWSAHRIEELVNVNKIIRPAYMSVAENKEYVPINKRDPNYLQKNPYMI